MSSRKTLCLFWGILVLGGLTACGTRLPDLPTSAPKQPYTSDPSQYEYLIGPGDSLNVFVWRNPEVSSSVSVRPDGKITTPLVEDLPAINKTPTQLARDIESVLSEYIKNPVVTVTVGNYVGPFNEQIRIVGQAANPRTIAYRQNITLLDVMIEVGGLTDYADGNGARVLRVVDGKQVAYRARLDDLVKDGEVGANAELLPGDIIIIPEAKF